MCSVAPASTTTTSDGSHSGSTNGIVAGHVVPKPSILMGASVSRVFDALFVRLLDSMDDPVSQGSFHFFGGTLLSVRSSLRALIRTSMSGNKIQLEKMRVYLCAKMDAADAAAGFFGDRAWMWVANADRELCSRIRSKDLQGALFHAFEGELLRHVAKGPAATAEVFKHAELKGGIQAALGGPVQARVQRFSMVMLGQEHLREAESLREGDGDDDTGRNLSS